MTQIIIAKEKYNDRIFVVNSIEDIAKVSLKILRERYESGEYISREEITREIERKKSRKREKLDEQLLNITDEELESSPDAVKKLVLAERAKSESAEKISYDDAMDLQFIDEVEKILSMPIDDAVKLTSTNRLGRTISIPWNILQNRSDYQYEEVVLEETESY